MTKEQAFIAAQKAHKAYMAADIEHMFRGDPEPIATEYGRSGGGWYTVQGFTFPDYQLEGRPMHCPVQAAFAYL